MILHPPPPSPPERSIQIWWRCCIIHRETFLFYRTNDPSSRGLQIIWFEITLIRERYSCWYCAPVFKYFCVKFIKETKFFFFFGVHTAMTVANIAEKNAYTASANSELKYLNNCNCQLERYTERIANSYI